MIRFQHPSLTAEWEAGFQAWKRRGSTTTEVGESSRSSKPSATDNDPSASSTAGLESRVGHLEALMRRMAGQNDATGVRVRVLEEDRDMDHVTIATTRIDLVDA